MTWSEVPQDRIMMRYRAIVCRDENNEELEKLLQSEPSMKVGKDIIACSNLVYDAEEYLLLTE